MTEIIFKAWEKIPRDNPFNVTITEKIDGTNACIIIKDEKIIGIQSRKRLIYVENDNFGFARWVWENAEELIKLGDGYHYGEWAGPGIQKNPHNLDRKRFFLFNTFRWNPDNPNKPECCDVVPILYHGTIEGDTIKYYLDKLEALAKEDETPEGIIVYYHTFRKYTKHTIKSPNGKWCK
jgi:hypothetical protein